MSRWWHSDNNESSKRTSGDSTTFQKPRAKAPVDAGDCRLWKFKVFLNFDLMPNEKVALTGSCDQLGSWALNDSLMMDVDTTDENVWTKTVLLPVNTEVQYRYFISANDPTVEEVHVRKWETHMQPRKINSGQGAEQSSSQQEAEGESFDTFGDINGQTKVDRGWLTSETVVQFIFYKNPFMLNERMKNRKIYVKLTPMNLRVSSEAQDMSAFLEDSLSNDTRENSGDHPAYSFVEVATLSSGGSSFESQPQFGRAYEKDNVLIFHVTIIEPENVAYLIDLYAYSSRHQRSDDTDEANGPLEPPTHLGYHYILPNLLKRSEGQIECLVTCASRHRPLGMMRVEYLKITPYSDHQILTLEKSFIRHWNPKWKGLEIGHRGSGTSFKATEGNVIRENTIASLKKAASNGADMVEFDVQLSKDLVPVIYHDFMVYVSLKRKTQLDTNDMLELPMGELNLEQLKNLKVYHTEEGKKREAKFFDEDLEEHQPFPTLQLALDTIDTHVGFNIEIKWSQRYENGSWESNNLTDKNIYLDCILDVTLKHASNRRIVFSCFDPDICTMLRLKQNIFPVMFLTIGSTAKYQKYFDPRCNSHGKAIEHAQAMELLGIVGHSEDLLRDQSQVKQTIDNGLTIFCWGDDNNSPENIRLLKNLGLHAIIYDKMDVYSTKERKENIFLLEARENQKVWMEMRKAEVANGSN